MTRNLIIVEGENDKKFIHSLSSYLGLAIPSDVVHAAGDKDTAKIELKTQLKSSHLYDMVSIILDADDNPNGTWQSVLGVLERSGKYDVKQNLPLSERGIIIEPNQPDGIKVGIWIIPNNQETGMLEDFVASLIKNDDKLFAKAKDVVSELNENRENYEHLFKKVHTSKAVMYSWLAWRNPPEQTMEQAVKKHVFDDLKMESENCQCFIDWLKQVVTLKS